MNWSRREVRRGIREETRQRDVGAGCRKLRLVKSPAEIAYTRKAGKILDRSLEAVIAARNQAAQARESAAVVPGDPFGCPKNIRLSFACSMEQIEKGVDRVQEWLKA